MLLKFYAVPGKPCSQEEFLKVEFKNIFRFKFYTFMYKLSWNHSAWVHILEPNLTSKHCAGVDHIRHADPTLKYHPAVYI